MKHLAKRSLQVAEFAKTTMRRTQRSRRCHKCENCLNQDCGRCKNCLDMPKFGGKGRRQRACINRNCTNLTLPFRGFCVCASLNTNQGDDDWIACVKCEQYVVFDREAREFLSFHTFMFQLREKKITLISLTHTARESLGRKSTLKTIDFSSSNYFHRKCMKANGSTVHIDDKVWECFSCALGTRAISSSKKRNTSSSTVVRRNSVSRRNLPPRRTRGSISYAEMEIEDQEEEEEKKKRLCTIL